MNFQHALPRLVQLYEKGLLVPFLGAGMSIGACEGWEGLISKLERHLALALPKHEPPADAHRLIQRAHRVVRKLRYGGAKRLEDALHQCLGTSPEPPPQTQALAKIWWPLVLTTNYDNCFSSAFNRHFSGMRIRGRSPADCQRVLTSLTAPSVPILWALQGYLATPCPPSRDDEASRARLAPEIVFGHEEYRRATHKELHFRRAFSELYRSRSLLFLGSGLRDPYLLELLGEVLENLGPTPFPHYALAPPSAADADFLRTRLNTIVIPYQDHADLPGMLEAFREAIDAPRVHQMRWTYALECSTHLDASAVEREDLELVRGRLPLPQDGECAAVSVGRTRQGELVLGEMVEYVEQARAKWGERALPPPVAGSFVSRVGASPLFLVTARRSPTDDKELRSLSLAVTELLDQAHQAGFSRLRLQLLGTGKGGFPPRFSLIETLRAFAAWHEARGPGLKVSIHVVDPGVLFNVATGRVDIPEILSCQDLRFWVQLVLEDAAAERQLFFAAPTLKLHELLSELDLPRSQWMLEVSPAPSNDARAEPVDTALDRTLEELGVVPGVTLRFFSSGKRREADL